MAEQCRFGKIFDYKSSGNFALEQIYKAIFEENLKGAYFCKRLASIYTLAP